MGASFAVRSRRSGCCELIQLSGELALGTADLLEAVLDRMMVIPDHIVFDVSELIFVDSAGLRILVRASQLVEGRIEIRGANRQLRQLLQITGSSSAFCLAQIPEVAHRIISRRRSKAVIETSEGPAR